KAKAKAKAPNNTRLSSTRQRNTLPKLEPGSELARAPAGRPDLRRGPFLWKVIFAGDLPHASVRLATRLRWA
ncbi:MAG: hypothetical protein ACLFQH_08980, partial [Halothiobacillaceae bacterium]